MLKYICGNFSLKWIHRQLRKGFGGSDHPGSRYWTLDSYQHKGRPGYINLEKYNQLHAVQHALEPGAFVDEDLSDFVSHASEDTGLKEALLLLLRVDGKGSLLRFSPSPENGLQWFFDKPDSGFTLRGGGFLATGEPLEGPGCPVSPLSRLFRLHNIGQVALSVDLVVLGAADLPEGVKKQVPYGLKESPDARAV